MPDILVLAGLIPRLGGAKIILDLHDPTPEVFMAKYGIAGDHPLIRVLRSVERWSIRRADTVLTPNVAFRDLFLSRGAPSDKVHVIMNAPDPAIFGAAGALPSAVIRRRADELLVMYHGTVVERHGLDTALEALARIRDDIGPVAFHVFGEGDFVPRFLELRRLLGLEEIVTYHGHVSLEEIAAAIRVIDVGLIPNKRNAFTEINLPTRIFEYLALGKHVVAPRTCGILDYFTPVSLNLFEPGNAESLAGALQSIRADAQRAAAILEQGKRIYRDHCWDEERRRFLGLISDLSGMPETP